MVRDPECAFPPKGRLALPELDGNTRSRFRRFSLRHLGSFNVRSRLLPTLRPVTDSWERARDTWRALAPMTTGIPYPVAAAAHALHQALHSPELEPGSETRHALRLAVIATVEAAHLQVQATRRSDLKGIASGVSALNQ